MLMIVRLYPHKRLYNQHTSLDLDLDLDLDFELDLDLDLNSDFIFNLLLET